MAKGRSKKVPQGEPSLLILPYNQHLLSAVYEVFYQAVHVTCAQHYNSEQLAAWAPKFEPNLAANFNARLERRCRSWALAL